MPREDDEAQASTIAHAGTPTAVEDRSSRPNLEDFQRDEMIGRYQLVERLGAGAMGVVWSAQDPQLDRRVAIKLVHASLARSGDASKRLLQEARAMAKLSNRAVVTVHDAGEVDGRLFLAMELVEGTTLGTMLRARDASALADWPRWLDMMLEAGRGLAAAHRAGVLHRDFKPDNVLVDTAGRVCVGDFGLASLGDTSFVSAAVSARWEVDKSLDLTTTGALLGTPAYMSPQQLRGELVDARADQFAFCVATFEALYGARPFRVTEVGFDALPALVEAIEAKVLPDPPAGSTVPDAVREVLRRGLAADPELRWPDIDTVLKELERAAKPGRRRMASVVEHSPPRPPRRNWLHIAISVAAMAVVASVVGYFVATRSGPEPAGVPIADPRPLVAARLFDLPARGRIALSPDGKHIAIASDRMEVRDFDGSVLHSIQIGVDEVHHMEFDGASLRFATQKTAGISRWRYEVTTAIDPPVYPFSGRWSGSTASGDLVVFPGAMTLLDAAGHEIDRWSTASVVEIVAISPDKRRLAFVAANRFAGNILVRDLATGVTITTEKLVGATALAWIDDSTLAYALGISDQPTIYRRSVSSTGFGPPTKLYSTRAGWFGEMEVHEGRLFFSDLHPSTRSKMIDRSQAAPKVVDYDRASVGVTLGWTASNELVSWSRDRKHVEIRSGEHARVTDAILDGEPANTTFANEVLIASVRGAEGRETLAVSLVTGKELWRHTDKRTFAVRCAKDLHPPCFAIRNGDGLGDDEILAIDPRTGQFGKQLTHGVVEDIAVRDDGQRVLIASRTSEVYELDLAGKQTAQYHTTLVTIRSVSYDPRGGVIVAGTLIRNEYRVGRIDEQDFDVLASSLDDILLLIRPAHDGSRILMIARGFSPDVWQLDLK